VIGMDRSTVWAAVDHERASLADLLDTLTEDEWATPSLCNGWTVRDVVAHLTLTAIGPGVATIALLRYGGSLDRTARETARRRAAVMSSAELIERLRGLVGSRRHLFGTRYVDSLVDVLVHGQDIAVPLGRERAMPLDAAVTAINRVAAMGYWMGKRRRLRGLRLEATDARWTRGDGAVVRGPVAVLLLLLTGRRTRLDELSGVGRERLVRAA
jgi:uncharacterized protein (TIGR03083 family)